MGVESRKERAPPLPAPTETSTTDSVNENDNAELESRVTEKSTYSLPEDGSPVTIPTRKKKNQGKDSSYSELASNNKSQTSLLIEYFEGGKEEKSRRPSVRVKVTPSSKHRSKSAHDHIQITERKGNRRPSYTQRIQLSPRPKEDKPLAPDDENSMGSFRSTTEESNVTSRSGRPIEVEIMRHGSPLIPTDLGSKSGIYNASEISSMPADSFLDGHTRSPERKRSRSLTRGEALVAGAATGVAAGVAADKLRTPSRRRSRSLSRERIVAQKAVEKVRGERSRRRKHRSRSRSVSGEKLGEELRSPRRRSSRSHNEESLLSGADSSVANTNSQVSRNSDKYSYKSATSKSSINNPKLLETVEDAIRRLILPELKELKREQSKRDANGRRISTGSGVSKDSKEDMSRPRVTLNDGEVLSGNSVKSRKDRSISSSRSFERDGSEDTVTQDERIHKKHSGRGLEAAAAGAGIGALTAAALEKHQSTDSVDEKKERRRRRKNHSRGNSLGGELREDRLEVVPPPMPLMSDINASDITRTSILSAETERPDSAHSASQERMTPLREVSRGIGSPSSRTPTRTPVDIQHGLGTQHSNFSRGNLSLHSQDSGQRLRQEYDLDENGRKVPMHDHYDPDLDDSFVSEEQNAGHPSAFKAGAAGAIAGAGLAALHHEHVNESEVLEDEPEHHPYYQNTQEVPPPLRYIPYGHERRGLSPIQSVSGYTENEDGQTGNHRDSRLTQSTGSYSSLAKSALDNNSLRSLNSNVNITRHDFSEVRQGGLTDSELTQDGDYWEEQHRENDRNRELDSDVSDNKRMNNYTDDSLDRRVVSTGQDIKGLGANPNYVNTPIGVESAVASLVNASDLTGTNSYPGNSQYDRRASYASFDDDSEKNFTSRGNSPTKSPTKYEEEDELNDNGRRTPKSHTKEKLGGAALGANAAALLARARQAHSKMNNDPDKIKYQERQEHTGAPPEMSFKERTMNGQRLSSPRHSIDNLSEISHPRMTANGIPDLDDPMPEIGYGDEDSELMTNPSIIQGPIGGTQQGSRDHWPNQATPPQANHQDSALKEAEAGLIGAAAGAGAAAAVSGHNRDLSQDIDDEWRRTSSERKRDTLITNPYEDTSPIARLGNGTGLDQDILNHAGLQNANREYNSRLYPAGSPGALPKDEGYISSAPNARSIGAQTPEQNKGKGVGFRDKELGSAADALGGGDTFYPNHSRHLSGMSQGVDSPLYDSATGNGMDRIQSKDIVALMDHLTVRDAQRSARDTEILVTLVRAAAEMRNSFEDMKRLLADTEDVIITEVQGNTERSVQKVINGPRPLPPSAPRSIRSQGDMFEDLPNKRRNVFRRALKGLSKRSTNDLGKIEDMLVQLLGDVEGLKVAQGLQAAADSTYDDYQPEGRSEPDRGYEPEGNAGTSTASHASQSGHLSIPPQSRVPSGKGFDGRKFSDHRISTVPEDDEDELDPHEEDVLNNQFENNEALLTPKREIYQTYRGESVSLDTPPQQQRASGSLSNENTPRTDTDKTKKHKSSSSSGWIPKVSRWSETTASTVFKGFRSSGRNSGRKENEQYNSPPRSDSGLGTYTTEQDRDQERQQDRDIDQDNYVEHEVDEAEDKLHSGFSQEQLHQQYIQDENSLDLLPPEDPKYKAHRNSLNLQHPQPRPGPTHRYQTHLESQAQNYGQPMSPPSINWGSTTSLNPPMPAQQTNRYSQGTTNTERNLSPISDGGYSDRSASGQAPARPPKEPIVPEKPLNIRNKLQKPSPLSNEHLASENYETASGGSPRSTSQRMSGALGVPARKPTGPRSMSSASRSGELNRDDGTVIRRNVNRDTFGTIASHHSGESETF